MTNEAAIRILKHELYKALEQQVTKDTNVTNNDCISRQAAINAVENTDCELSSDAWDEITDAIMQVPSVQPEETCDTCKHSPFGDSRCEQCRVGRMSYPSYYERRTDE